MSVAVSYNTSFNEVIREETREDFDHVRDKLDVVANLIDNISEFITIDKGESADAFRIKSLFEKEQDKLLKELERLWIRLGEW